jgi:hypothetical protein
MRYLEENETELSGASEGHRSKDPRLNRSDIKGLKIQPLWEYIVQ